jgi:hypothetical protein
VEDPGDFDLDALRLPQDFSKIASSMKELASVPVRKPHPQWWVRVHPDEDFSCPVYLFNYEETNEMYIVHPKVEPLLSGLAVEVRLYTAINSLGMSSSGLHV